MRNNLIRMELTVVDAIEKWNAFGATNICIEMFVSIVFETHKSSKRIGSPINIFFSVENYDQSCVDALWFWAERNVYATTNEIPLCLQHPPISLWSCLSTKKKSIKLTPAIWIGSAMSRCSP